MNKKPFNHKPIFTLSHVVHETGVKADTLRAWERRYQLPHPARSEGDQRLYSDQDIKTIKWLVHQKNNGLTISKAVALWTELNNQGENPISSNADQISINNQSTLGGEGAILSLAKQDWIEACLNFDEATAEQVLMHAFARFTMEIVISQILQAGISDIGTLWQQGGASVQQEHFASQLAIRKANTLISSAPIPTRNKTILIACPEGENHTFASLLISVLLRYQGWNVVDLGTSVPTAQMEDAIGSIKPDVVLMTAMRLATAASLLDPAVLMNTLQIPLAFGGWIFNQIPNLSERIPGYFLGEDISDTAESIETLLARPNGYIPFKPAENNLYNLVHLFNERKYEINQAVFRYFEERSIFSINHTQIIEANFYLAQDITAALALGDITLITYNLTWMIDLLKNRGISDELVAEYLSVYQEKVNDLLGNEGAPISSVLAHVFT